MEIILVLQGFDCDILKGFLQIKTVKTMLQGSRMILTFSQILLLKLRQTSCSSTPSETTAELFKRPNFIPLLDCFLQEFETHLTPPLTKISGSFPKLLNYA